MNTRIPPLATVLAAIVLFFFAGVPCLQAHVKVIKPNGGEVLAAGSAYTLEWGVIIPHNTKNWDLWYSTTGENGPWIEGHT